MNKKWKYNITKLMGYNKGSYKRKVHSNKTISTSRKKERSQITYFIPQESRKSRMN